MDVPLATASNVAAVLQRDVADLPADIDELLDLASGLVRGFCRQTISRVADDQVTLDGAGRRVLPLPELPVVSVTSVSVREVVVDPALYWADGHGLLHHLAGRWSGPVTVTYTHGHDPVPADVVAVTAQAVARQTVNPDGVRSESVGAYAITHTTPGTGQPFGLLLTAVEQDALTVYRPGP